jgi:two-component system sensor histidine kinase HydH
MLPPVKVRVPPLAVAFALMAAALVATTWWTRSTVEGAFATVRDGQARAVEAAVRADLVELEGLPSNEDLDGILRGHASEGLRYLALVDARGDIFAAAGTPLGHTTPTRGDRSPVYIGGRIRIEQRVSFRRGWGVGGRARIALEVEPAEARALESAATRDLAIGAIAALTLLGVAVALVRRELRRNAEERAREHERRLASLGEMSAVLAHEIKNPLASLKGNAQLLASALPAGDKAQAKAERVVGEAQRLEQLVQDLLAFVRTGELHREPTEVGDLVRAAAGDAQVELDVQPITWPLDRDRMRQVLANLIENAIAAGPPVRISARVERDQLILAIADRGPGVPEADRERIFEPFFTGKTQGTGLGLAIARRIVEGHGGRISVHNDGGAVFRVQIPR